MELLKVFYTSVTSIIALFILTKIMGNREMSHVSMFDFIVSITIGSIAAEMATALEDDYREPLIAMTVYALISVLISIALNKWMWLRRIIEGKSLILYENGTIYDKNLKKAKLNINEFLAQCRISGYFNLADLQCAILEPNGRISFLPLPARRPATPCDLNLTPPMEKPVYNVIIDGQILPRNLSNTGNSEEWLIQQLRSQGILRVSDVFLATCDDKNNLSAYVKGNMEMKGDPFT